MEIRSKPLLFSRHNILRVEQLFLGLQPGLAIHLQAVAQLKITHGVFSRLAIDAVRLAVEVAKLDQPRLQIAHAGARAALGKQIQPAAAGARVGARVGAGVGVAVIYGVGVCSVS